MASQNTKLSLTVAAIGIFATAVGALITGYFGYQSTQKNAEALTNSISRQNAQEEVKVLREKSEEFINSVVECFIIIESDEPKQKFSEKIDEVNLASVSLSLYASDSLATQSLRLTQSLNKLANSKYYNDSKNIDSLRKVFNNKSGKWLQQVRSDISSYKFHSMPDKIKSDFRKLLIKSVLEY